MLISLLVYLYNRRFLLCVLSILFFLIKFFFPYFFGRWEDIIKIINWLKMNAVVGEEAIRRDVMVA